MKKTFLLASLLSVGAMATNPLIKQATEAGLKPLPQSEAQIFKLVDNKQNPITKAKVELGKKLYFDPRLSKSGLISCNTCHNLALGGVDGVEAAIGHHWTANPHHLNSPTVYNSVLNQKQFWDGRSPDLEDQAQGPIQAAPEMAAPKDLVVGRINSIPQYLSEFQTAYGKEVKIDFKTIANTIATFERTLITPSRYDAFLSGYEEKLSKEEQEGLKLFIDKGCTACHTGVALGGGMQVFDANKKYKYKDVGDFKGDKNGMVKVPTLRNIEETAPYFHNGKIWSLKEAVQEMGTTQLSMKISDGDANKIVTFLKSLTGQKPNVKYPVLPASTEKTAKPNVK